MTDQRTGVVFANVSDYVKFVLYRICKAQGISLNEYIRSLILTDLTKRRVFDGVWLDDEEDSKPE